MLKITTLDLATKTGWASGYPDEDPHFGLLVMPKTGEDIGAFAAAFDEKVNDLLVLENPDIVVFEAPIFLGNGKSSISTARKLMGLAWHTEFVCKRRGIICREGHLQSVKKFFAGSGRADKTDMITVAKGYGWNVKDDNEADALGLWTFTVHTKYPEHARRFALGRMGAHAA